MNKGSRPIATVILTELEAFHKFLGECLKNGRCSFTVDQSAEAFRAYQREREQLREEIRPALERSLRGETKPFDPEGLKARVTHELAEKGVTE